MYQYREKNALLVLSAKVTSLFAAELEEVQSRSNSVLLNMSLIIWIKISFDAAQFIGLLRIVLSYDECLTKLHIIFRMPINSGAFPQVIRCFIIFTDEYSWK